MKHLWLADLQDANQNHGAWQKRPSSAKWIIIPGQAAPATDSARSVPS